MAQHQFADLSGGQAFSGHIDDIGADPERGAENEPGFIGWLGVPVKMQPPTSVPPEILMIGIFCLQTCWKNHSHGVCGPGLAAGRRDPQAGKVVNLDLLAIPHQPADDGRRYPR